MVQSLVWAPPYKGEQITGVAFELFEAVELELFVFGDSVGERRPWSASFSCVLI